MKDRIIELDNKTQYYVIEEMWLAEKKYVLLSKKNIETEKFNETEFTVKEINILDGKINVKTIEDENFANEIAYKLISKFRGEE